MKIKRKVLLLIISIDFVFSVFARTQSDFDRQYDLADSLIKNRFGIAFEVGALLNVEKTFKDTDYWGVDVHEDLKGQLRHKLIVAYGKWDSIDAKDRPEGSSGISLNDSGGIVLIKDGKIDWYSKRLILNYSSINSRIMGFADLNKDGTTDIIYASLGGYHGELWSLWLISPDTNGGKLLNEFQDRGYSSIVGSSFKYYHDRKKGTIIIECRTNESKTVTRYKWDGKKYSLNKK